jgi:hypothetical protein
VTLLRAMRSRSAREQAEAVPREKAAKAFIRPNGSFSRFSLET